MFLCVSVIQSNIFECFKKFFMFVSVSGEGITVVRVSRVSASTPRGAEEDPQLSQYQQQSDKQACTVSKITQFMYVQQGCSKQLLSSWSIFPNNI